MDLDNVKLVSLRLDTEGLKNIADFKSGQKWP